MRPTFSVNVGSAVRPPPPRSTTDVDEFVQLVMQVNASAAKSEGCAPAVSSKSEETKSKAGLQPTTRPCPKRVYSFISFQKEFPLLIPIKYVILL